MSEQSSSIATKPFMESSSDTSYATNQRINYNQCPNYGKDNAGESWWKKPEAIIMFMGMILTGIIGYFTATFTLKDNIANNFSKISVIETKILHIEKSIDDTKKTSELAQKLERDLAVVQSRIDYKILENGLSNKK